MKYAHYIRIVTQTIYSINMCSWI